MKLVLRLVETGIDSSSRSVDVLEIVGRGDPGDVAALGVTLGIMVLSPKAAKLGDGEFLT